MQSTGGVENIGSGVRPGKGPDENQSREKSLPELLEYKLAPIPERSISSTNPASGSHSNAVFRYKRSGTTAKALESSTFELSKT